MAVILTDGDYTLERRPHPFASDSHGMPIPAALDLPTPALPGAATIHPDRSWSLRLDPTLWPTEAGDRVSDGVRSWTVIGEPRLIRHPVAGDVDYIAVSAALDPPEVP